MVACEQMVKNMTNTTEKFDVRRQKWKKGPVLPNPRAQYGATGKQERLRTSAV